MFSDGLPKFVAMGSNSLPSRPSKKAHSACLRHIDDFYEIPGLSDKLQNAVNYAWTGAQTTEGHFYYRSENDVVMPLETSFFLF